MGGDDAGARQDAAGPGVRPILARGRGRDAGAGGAAPAVLLAVASIWPLRHAGTALVIATPIDRPDAIVSLASHEWERLPDAAALARGAPNAKVLLSQPIALNAFNCHDCGHRVDRLVAAGVQRPDRADGREGLSDAGRGRGVQGVGGGASCASVVIVTSPYHTVRALASFRHVLNGTGIAVGVHPATGSPAEPRAWWWAQVRPLVCDLRVARAALLPGAIRYLVDQVAVELVYNVGFSDF